MTAAKRIRVLVVDDSAVARDLLERGLSMDAGLEVVGTAEDAYAARDKIVLRRPDVVTLDVEMPRMDGIEFLKRLLPQYPIPVVVVSAVTPEGSRRALEALEAGAMAVVAKPRANDRDGLMSMLAELAEAVKEAARADMSKVRRNEALARARHGTAPGAPRPRLAGSASAGRLVAIGASTGGTTALTQLINDFPPDMPATVVVQHMPPVFTRMFAQALDRSAKVTVKEAEEGDILKPGLVLIAPGDFHLRLRKLASGWSVGLAHGPKVSGHRPSVDVMFLSVAQTAGDKAVGLLLTGMGRDGADGLLAMRRSGARCLAQNEASSVVYGMPKEAWESGAADRQVGLDDAVEAILACLSEPRARRA